MADTDREARERFAANIQRLRRREGLTIEELAQRARIDARELEEIVRGEREAGFRTIASLAGALGIDPEGLLRGIRWISPGEDGRGRFEIEGPEDDQRSPG